MAAKNTCADCRHFTRDSGWCAVYAKWVSRFAARCDYGALCIRADRAVRLMDAKRRDAGKPKRKYDAKKRAPKLKRMEAGARPTPSTWSACAWRAPRRSAPPQTSRGTPSRTGSRTAWSTFAGN